MTFFAQLNFTSANEDGRSELHALAGARRVACLCGSGARPLDMLLGEADEVIALDLNPAQLALLELKIAVFSGLDHEGALAFLGITPSRERLRTYARLRPALTPSARDYWDRASRVLARGVWYAGLWEKVLRLGALGVRLVRRGAVDQLFAAPNVSEQHAIWRRRFDDRLWRASIRLLGRPWIWTRIVGEPGGDFLPSPAEVEARLAGAFDRAAGAFFFRESDFAALILRGRHDPSGALPLHLRPERYARVRARLGRLRLASTSLADLGRGGLGPIDGFSLSDFGSYCDQKAYDACWAGVLAAAAPDARFCERVFMNALAPTSARVSIDEALSTRLTREDTAIIYHVRAGVIRAA